MADPTTPAASVWPYVAFTAVVFGSGGLVAKALVDDGWDPFTLTWLPFMIGGVFGLAVGAAMGHLRRSALGAGILLGLFAGTIPAALFNNGFDRLPAGLVTLFISLAPVVTALVAHFVFPDERFNPIKAGGLVLAVVGVAVLASGSLDGDGDGAGMVMVIVGAAVAGSAAVMQRVFATRHGALPLIAPQLMASAVLALILTLVLGRPFAPPDGVATWHVALMVPFGLSGFFGFLAALKANEIGTTGQVSVIGYCIPVFGVIGGALIFGDEVTPSVVVGGALIMASMAVIARGSKGTTEA